MEEKIKQLEENLKQTEAKINETFYRIEEKVNYIINLLEMLFDNEDTEEEEELDDSNEGWISGLDSWKDDYNPDDGEI